MLLSRVEAESLKERDILCPTCGFRIQRVFSDATGPVSYTHLIQSDGIEELFETGKHISVDIFSDEYMDKINAIQLPNTKKMCIRDRIDAD